MSETSSNSSGPVTRSMSRRSSLCSSLSSSSLSSSSLSSSSLCSSIPLGGSASSVCSSSASSDSPDYVKVSGRGLPVVVIKN